MSPTGLPSTRSAYRDLVSAPSRCFRTNESASSIVCGGSHLASTLLLFSVSMQLPHRTPHRCGCGSHFNVLQNRLGSPPRGGVRPTAVISVAPIEEAHRKSDIFPTKYHINGECPFPPFSSLRRHPSCMPRRPCPTVERVVLLTGANLRPSLRRSLFC